MALGIYLRLDDNDNTYDPQYHAYSPHKKKNGEEVCWYCGEQRHHHQQEVVIEKEVQDGKTKYVRVVKDITSN